MTKAILLALILTAPRLASPQQPPTEVDICKLIAAHAEYNGKTLSVEGILIPGDHSVLLYSPSCKPRESFDVGIQSVFPPNWASSSNGKQLHKLLSHRKNASVKLIGTFESGAGRYGPDVARFRFTIIEISSVKKAPPDGAQRSPASDTLAHESGHVDPPNAQ
jgi:hypothetical protein